MNIGLDLTGDLCSESVVSKHIHSHNARVLGSFSKSAYSLGYNVCFGWAFIRITFISCIILQQKVVLGTAVVLYSVLY